jgi:hypothetical protein
MKQIIKKALGGLWGKSNKNQPEIVTIPDDELRFRLGIKLGHKVCLFHPPKHYLPLFLTGDIKLTLDWAESDSDVILYWAQPEDDAADIMTNLEGMIKRRGCIWFIVPPREDGQGQEDIREAVLSTTSLVGGRTLHLSAVEYGLQFTPRKAAKDDAGA